MARENIPVGFSAAGETRVAKTRETVDRWIREKRVIYGITTGFGALCTVPVSAADSLQLQENILMSHAAGIGKPLPEETVRTVMALRGPRPLTGLFRLPHANPALPSGLFE